MDAAAETSTATAAIRRHMGGAKTACKISMLWNWNTIDACFMWPSLRIRSNSAFAGTCIGIIFLVMLLELLRRTVKEYDRYLIRTHLAKQGALQASADALSATIPSGNKQAPVSSGSTAPGANAAACAPCGIAPFRPSVLQQAMRAGLHTLQFAAAYFIMLFAMYYNGYIIICIFIGAYVGSFVFQWESLADGGAQPTTSAQEATVCCG